MIGGGSGRRESARAEYRNGASTTPLRSPFARFDDRTYAIIDRVAEIELHDDAVEWMATLDDD
jgi:hypothetical protein